MRISDWSSDVCSSDLDSAELPRPGPVDDHDDAGALFGDQAHRLLKQPRARRHGPEHVAQGRHHMHAEQRWLARVDPALDQRQIFPARRLVGARLPPPVTAAFALERQLGHAFDTWVVAAALDYQV